MKNPKLLGGLCLALLLSLSARAQPNWQWAQQHGGTDTFVDTTRLAVDAAGNSHVTGHFSGTATFGSTTFTSAGNKDLFVAKVDTNGNLLWARTASGAENVFGRSIAVDPFGNVFVTGSFAGSATFDSQTVTTTTGGDVFVAKYDPSGNLLWVRSGGGGTGYRDESFAITTDDNGDAYITGYFIGTATFGNLPPVSSAGWWDIFVVAYDASGNEQWATRAGGSNSGWYAEAGRGIAVDSSGHVYVAGHFIGTADFGSHTVTATGPLVWPPPADMFVARYNQVLADWDWVETGGGDEGDRATDLHIDASGNLYVAGIFEGTATIGNATMTASPSRNSDYFVGKYSANGTVQWVVPSGGTAFYKGHGIGLDPAGNVYLAATFEGTAQVGNTTLTSAGYDNVYVTKISPAGNFEWVVHPPAGYYHVASDVGADSFGNVYAAGWFRNQATFDQTVLSSSGTTDLFLAKLRDDCEWALGCPERLVIEDCSAVVPDMAEHVGIRSDCANADDFTISQDPPAGSPLSEGQHQVVVTVTGPNGEVRACEVTVNVRCPPCETDQVLLNTGYDHTAAGVYSIGAADAFWTVVADPDSNTTEPRPATVVSPYSGWQPALPDSRWITAYPTSRNDINGPYDFETTFCLADGWSDVQLKLCLRADDEAEVYLNDQLILTTPNPSFNTQNPECETIIDQNLFMAGPNILRVRVINTNSVAMGLNLAATVTGAGLEDPRCCQPESSLSGQKFHDFHGTGVMDFGDPGLAGWTIELSDGNTTTTTVTDGNGFFYFMNLFPGTYTISEVQQPGWAQTAPQAGTYTVTIGSSQSVNGLNFGNQPCVQIQCPNLEPVPCQGPDGTFLDLEVIATSGCSDEVTVECDVDLSGPFWPGTTVVNCVAIDGEGNTAECQFEVTVVPDDQWSLDCPKDIVLTDCPAEMPDLTDSIGIQSQCWPLSDYTIKQDPPAGTPLAEGIHSAVVAVEAPDGTTRECEVMVTVRCEDKPNSPPALECPEDVIIDCGSPSGTSVTLHATVNDADGDSLTYVWEVDGTTVDSGSIPAGGPPTTANLTLNHSFAPGVSAVTLVVTDSEGNKASCEVQITIRASERPGIRCPEGVITIPAGDDCLAVLPDIEPREVWDDCTPTADLVITQDPPAGTALPPGMHAVVLTVTDEVGNSTSCEVEVRVADLAAPSIVCPDPQTVEACDGGAPVPDLIGEAVIIDNCDETADLILTQSPAPGTTVGTGTHTVTITAEDSSGNIASCYTTFTVTAPPASTDPIELFNTGVDSNGNVLPAGSVDPHYELVTSPDPNFPGPDARVLDSSSWWFNAPPVDSEHISSRADPHMGSPAGLYVFRKTFSLPPGTISANINLLLGNFTTTEIRLNGTTVPPDPWGWSMLWQGYNITSGFVPGTNTLEFLIDHTHENWSPTLRVQLEGQVIYCGSPCASPHILQEPVSLVRPIGSTATFSVSAGGTGPLDYQWYHNNNAILGATSPTLTISPVSLSDSGSYSAIVTNDCGEAQSRRAQLRVRRWRDSVVGQWDFEPSDPLGATVGHDIRYLDAGNDRFQESTAFATGFGSTNTFGIPGIDGQPVNVMRFSRTGPEMGYLVRADGQAGALNQHSFVFDLLLPEESVDSWRALLQANGTNDGEADFYVRAANETSAGTTDSDASGELILRPNEWTRVVVTADLDADQPVITWFVNGRRAGQQLLSTSRAALWAANSDGVMEMLLFTDGFGADEVGYVSSIQWHNAIICDLEIAALGKPAAGGIPASSPYLIRPQVVIEPERDRDQLILYWLGDSFRLQESPDLKSWNDVDLPRHSEAIEDEIAHEVIVPIPDDEKRFYRLIEE